MRRCRARSRRPWRRRYGLVGSAVLRATFWPTTALLLLLGSRACWPSALCCTAVAERGCVQQKHHGCCWLVLLPVHLEQLLRGAPGPAQLARRARARRRGRCAGWLALQRHPAAQGHVACLVFGVGQLVLHMENGLIEIFLSVCGSSTPAPSCRDERRRQTSGAAAAVPLAEWRAGGSW